jgi:hypothetical protein
MGTMIVTLDSEQTLSLPPEATSALGLRAGSRLAVTLKGGAIFLQPLLANSPEVCGVFSSDTSSVVELPRERQQKPVERDDLDDLCGILASDTDSAEELKAWRGLDEW